jgi:hypothetical protein
MSINRIARLLATGAVTFGVSAITALPATAATHHGRTHHRSHHASPHHASGGIPQHNGGDHDADNNGGPSDGDGNV